MQILSSLIRVCNLPNLRSKNLFKSRSVDFSSPGGLIYVIEHSNPVLQSFFKYRLISHLFPRNFNPRDLTLSYPKVLAYARSSKSVITTPFIVYSLTIKKNTIHCRYTAMMQQVLSTPYFYFSYTYDISHSRQRLDAQGSREFYQVFQFSYMISDILDSV